MGRKTSVWILKIRDGRNLTREDINMVTKERF